ncbi:hypothetical protein [Streptomyces sp. CA-132043]|uniref:hypothetical protein n=1 Tax=Streptomyces sp. CA-132043 TaxID=3240048 RepID=UPI003D8EABA8
MADIELGRVGDGLVVVRAPGATCQLAVLALARLLDRFGEEDFLAGVAAVVVGIDPQLELLPLIPRPRFPGHLQSADRLRQRHPLAALAVGG